MATAKKKHMSQKKKSQAWFKRVRGSYIPIHWKGWLTYIPYLGYLYLSFWLIDRGSHSIGDVILSLVPFWIAGVVIMHWIANIKSKA